MPEHGEQETQGAATIGEGVYGRKTYLFPGVGDNPWKMIVIVSAIYDFLIPVAFLDNGFLGIFDKGIQPLFLDEFCLEMGVVTEGGVYRLAQYFSIYRLF